MKYPKRTAATDAAARLIHASLQGQNAPGGGNNRCMITIVTTGGTDGSVRDMYIAVSGANNVGGQVRTAVSQLPQNDPLFAHVNINLINFADAGDLINPLNSPIATKPGDYQIANPRHCAEPKALLAAATSGNPINGMSTIWWGNVANPCPDANNNPGGFFAVPCDVCMANEGWVMARAGTAKDTAKGLPRKSYEI